MNALTESANVAAGSARDALTLYDTRFGSRFLLGTSRYPSLQVLNDSIDTARPGMVTVALRRQLSGSQTSEGHFWETLRRLAVPVLPNTAGCHSVQEAVTTAQMAREVFETDWIKLELIGDDYTLQPDPFGLVTAAEQLIRDGFKVLPYCTEDLVLCRRLLDVGCQALMINPYGLRLLRDRLPDTPLIVDAGLGLPSHACQVMEWGFDGVLLNTAVALAAQPVEMAGAFATAIKAGRAAWLAGPMAERESAEASTPVVGVPFWHDKDYS
jgi:thiazole synthase